ncbi:hypothetical protein C0991_012430 [Blastosporella zonata]|nr:hypothetical protein C0991_012430 [Blastosporella zonata]
MGDTLRKDVPGQKRRSWANTNSVPSAVSSIWSKSRIIDRQVPDIEVQSPNDADVKAQEKPMPRLAKTVGVLNILRKAFRPAGHRPGNVDLLSAAAALNGTTPSPYISPFRLVFPEQPSRPLALGGTIQDIEYSPDGALMATTCYDERSKSSTTTIYSAQSEYFQAHYSHRRHKVKQLSWSPASDKLLVRLERSVEIFDKTCKPILKLKRSFTIQSAVWSSSNFLLVEDHSIVEMNTEGRPSSMLWTLKLQPEPKLESYQTQRADHSQGPELTGHAYFVGDQDQMIACRGSDGDVHLWDRRTGLLVRRIRAKATTEGLRSFAWRPSINTAVTFASAHHKELKIWTSEQPPVQAPPPIPAAEPSAYASRAPSLEPNIIPAPAPTVQREPATPVAQKASGAKRK